MDGQLNLGYWFTLLVPLVSSGDASAFPQSSNTSPARDPGGAGYDGHDENGGLSAINTRVLFVNV